VNVSKQQHSKVIITIDKIVQSKTVNLTKLVNKTENAPSNRTKNIHKEVKVKNISDQKPSGSLQKRSDELEKLVAESNIIPSHKTVKETKLGNLKSMEAKHQTDKENHSAKVPKLLAKPMNQMKKRKDLYKNVQIKFCNGTKSKIILKQTPKEIKLNIATPSEEFEMFTNNDGYAKLKSFEDKEDSAGQFIM